MNQREYNSGYQAAIEEIRKHIQNQRRGGGQPQPPQNPQGGNSGQGGNGLKMPPGMGIPGATGQGGNSGQEGDNKRGSGSQGKPGVDDYKGPEVPGTEGGTGGMIDRKTGDKIVEKEGYNKEGGSDEQISREWKENALKAAKQMKQQGSGAAAFATRLEAIYKPTQDWKKELKRIVGQSINPDDPRQAFAHKNTLVSQDRIARADKDKYDSMDYMVAMVDTSGSMSEDDIKACLGELYGVALAKKPLKLVVMYFGGSVSQINVFKNLTEFKKEMKSPKIAAGGGTDVAPCFRMLANDPRFKKRAADLVMIFTDGYITQVKRNPKICKNLCWVIIDNPGFDLQYKDIKTKCVHIKTSDMK